MTETFHILTLESRGAQALRSFVERGGLGVHYADDRELLRPFELMETYKDRPMDLADASVISAAEWLGTRTIFTVDRNDFETYRIKQGHRHYPVDIV